MKLKSLIVLVLALLVSAMSGCSGGGGGGGGDGVPASPQGTTSISGVASKGPINSGVVKAYAISNGIADRSAPVGQGQTDVNGNYTISIGSYIGPLLVEVTGGSYRDEVNGTLVTLNAPLRAVISNAAKGTNTVAVTALTELAYQMALGEGTLTIAGIDRANSNLAAAFKLTDIISTLPVAGGATDAQKQYAFALGSISQFVNDNKNSGESLDNALPRLLTQIGNEMQSSGGLSIDTAVKLNDAMTAFATGGHNQTGSTINGLDSFTLKINTAGTASTIGGIDVTINFPAGVEVSSNPITGETAEGAITISGIANAGLNKLSMAKFSQATEALPGQLHLAIINATGFGLGEVAQVRIDLLPGGAFPANAAAFSVAGFAAKNFDGLPIPGVNAVLK